MLTFFQSVVWTRGNNADAIKLMCGINPPSLPIHPLGGVIFRTDESFSNALTNKNIETHEIQATVTGY